MPVTTRASTAAAGKKLAPVPAPAPPAPAPRLRKKKPAVVVVVTKPQKTKQQRAAAAVVIQRWWKHWKFTNFQSPFTLETMYACQPADRFVLVTMAGHRYRFVRTELIEYIRATGNFHNPFTLESLNNVELGRLQPSLVTSRNEITTRRAMEEIQEAHDTYLAELEDDVDKIFTNFMTKLEESMRNIKTQKEIDEWMYKWMGVWRLTGPELRYRDSIHELYLNTDEDTEDGMRPFVIIARHLNILTQKINALEPLQNNKLMHFFSGVARGSVSLLTQQTQVLRFLASSLKQLQEYLESPDDN